MTRPSKHRAKKKPRRRRGPGRWYYFFLAFVALGTLGASMGVGLLTAYVNSLPPIEKLENYDPPQVTSVVDRTGSRVLGQFSSERREYVEIDDVPEHLKQAFLAIEDAGFYDHYGVDLRGAIRAARANWKTGTAGQGASTITMQLPRNILDDEVGREKKLERKFKETILAFQIERRYSKDQILEFYLNHISMGHNSFGIRAAAENYFSKKLEELTIAECATLAAIPKGPSLYNPISHPEAAKRRRDYVVKRMGQLGWITNKQKNEALGEPLTVNRTRARSRVAHSEFPYFVDGLFKDLVGHYRLSEDELNRRGMVIRSTIEPRIQTIAEEELVKGLRQVERMWNERKTQRYWKEAEKHPGAPRAGQTRLAKIVSVGPDSLEIELEGYRGSIALPARLPYYEPENIIVVGKRIDVRLTGVDHVRETLEGRMADLRRIQGSIVILDVRKAEVLALVGGADFHDAANNGQYNRAVQGGRAAGSTVKPFFYAAALEAGFGPHDQIVDQAVAYPSGGDFYRPRNYENRFFGPTTLIEAVEHSRNVVTVRLFELLGKTQGFGSTLGRVALFDPTPETGSWRKKFRAELPMCLGPVDMNTLELASAYLVFANQGIKRRPTLFKEITDREGHKLYTPQTHESIVVSPTTARQMIYFMRRAATFGTGEREIGRRFGSAKYPPIAGKTGTTNGSTDAWFVGFTPDLVMVCYVGYDTPRTLGPQMTGGRVAAPIWANVFDRVHALRDDWRMSFEDPAGTEWVDVCAYSGKRVSENCSRWDHKTYPRVPYKAGRGPAEPCDGLRREPIIAPVGPDGRPVPIGGEPSFGFARGNP